MKELDINIQGLSFTINVPKEKQDEYLQIAKDLNAMIDKYSEKLVVRSDIRAVIQTAFMLAIDNAKMKNSLDNCEKRVDDLLLKLDNSID